MPNPVVHFEIQSTDADASRAFFQDVFDWKINVMEMASGMGYGLVDTDTEIGIGGGIGDTMDDQTRVVFYIQVDDVQAYLDRAVAAGGEVVMPLTVIPGAVTMALFREPSGAVVGLALDEAPPAE